MRRRPYFLLISALLMAGMCGACATRVETVTPKGEAPVTLRIPGRRTNHTAQFANRITITMPVENPATHRWSIALHDDRFLKQLTDVLPPKEAETGQTISFLAVRSGTTRLRFVLLPAGSNREATPIAAHELVVTIE